MTRHRSLAIVEAPSALGHFAAHRGVEKAPARLLADGVVDGLVVDHRSRVEATGYSADRDHETGVMNVGSLATYSPRLADAVGAVLDDGAFPVVLGGDCSILLGTMGALRRRGRFGLVYVDGDADYYQPEVNPIEGAASASDLAFATGIGPRALTEIEGPAPLVRPEDVVVFAHRDRDERRELDCQPLAAGIAEIDRGRVAELGPSAAAAEAVGLLEDGPDGFWVHLDADVLDESIMVAVDDPRPGGLGWEEAADALSVLLGADGAIGLQVTIYNPDFDPDGSDGRGLARLLNRVLRD